MENTLILNRNCVKCESCAVRNRAVCRAASPEAIEELNRLSRMQIYEKGSIIIDQGDETVLVGNVVSGIVKITNSFADGSHQIVGLLFPSDFFGRTFKKHSRFSYEAATDVMLCSIDRRDFEQILHLHPEIEHELLLSTLDELDAMREWIALIYCRTTLQRVATFLFILAKRSPHMTCDDGERAGKIMVTLPIGRRDIAAYIGTTPETISRNIHALERKGVIRIMDPRNFEILDHVALATVAGDVDGSDGLENVTLEFLP
ncbi:MAG: Crp/Fnr family transcriptional regulator [Stappiaceae bacterium]